MVSSFSYSGQIKEVVFSEKQIQNVTEYFQKSNFKMLQSITRKAISKCFGAFSEKQFQNVLGYFQKSNSKCFGTFSDKQVQNWLE